MRFWLVFVLAAAALGQTPEQRAIAYLEAEVRSWSPDNRCYSCHNNGDGARALYGAMAAGYRVRETALADTTHWLRTPAGWDDNKGDPGFSDKVLARLQWAAALAAAVRAAAVDRSALANAALALAPDQQSDGSWPADSAGSIGSPTTWGGALATALAVNTLRQADPAAYSDAIAAAEQWLRAIQPKNVPEATALALTFTDNEPAARGLRFLRGTQTSDGGWGPYPNAPSEVFDTALAVLALDDHPDLLKQGRDYLIRTQLSSGGWPETTRPSGSRSDAQHISTTGWALMALLATDSERD
jgi:squalene cyclase